MPKWDRKKILIVSHAVTIATFLYNLHGRSAEATVEQYQENKPDNCSVAHFRYNPDSNLHWDLIDWNKVLWKDE